MSVRLFILSLLSVSAFAAAPAPKGSVYSDVWAEVQKNPYSKLPSHQVTWASFFKGKTLFHSGTNLLEQDAARTIKVGTDILPTFQKLVHPIGICFAGVWAITEKNKYSGYFSAGSRGRIIVRASEAMGNPLKKNFRALGLAGKLYPTSNAKDPAEYETASFFTVDDLGGAKADSFLDLAKTNAPPVSVHLATFVGLPAVVTIINAFSAADPANPNVRQLYQISELGLADKTKAATPYLMSLDSENTERPGDADFRDELRLKNFKHGLKFSISVADEDAAFTKIGVIELDEEALTESCDHRLHFGHPKWKD